MKLVEFAIRRPVTVGMFCVAILLFGSVSLTRLELNLLPNITYPNLTVRTDFSGAAPTEVEMLITKPIEQVVGVVRGLRQLRSVSRAGQSDVMLEFAWGTNMDNAVLEVREKLDGLELPKEISRPLVLRFDPAAQPIVRLGLVSTSQQAQNSNSQIANLKRLRRSAELIIQKNLETVSGVAAAKISGGLEDEIHVLLDQAKLAQLDISIETVIERVSAENVNLSGGRIDEGNLRYLVRTLNQFDSLQAIEDTIIISRGQTPVYLSDVAKVQVGFHEREAIIRINQQEAVEIALYKEGDANTVSVARRIDARLEMLERQLADNLQLVKLYDQANFISDAIDSVIVTALIGGLLAVVVLYLFLRNAWATAVIALVIPVSVIATFNMMYANDLSLNIMTLGGIALAIGLLVDNAIVVLENIARQREQGKSLAAAVRDGTSEVSRAVTASTLTTVAVFFPMVFVQGVAGQLFSDQALIISFALLMSLLVSLTLIPMLIARGSAAVKPLVDDTSLYEPAINRGSVRQFFYRIGCFSFVVVPVGIVRYARVFGQYIARQMHNLLQPVVGLFQCAYIKLEIYYDAMLIWALARPARVLGITLLLFMGSIALLPRIGMELMPAMAQGEFGVELRLPPGTPLAITDQVVIDAHQRVAEMPEIATFYSVTGTGNRLDVDPESGGENFATLNVVLNDQFNAGINLSSDEAVVMQAISTMANKIPGLTYRFTQPTLFSLDQPLVVEVSGHDFNTIQQATERVIAAMNQTSRFNSIKSTLTPGFPEIQIQFDQVRAAQLGLSVSEIANRVVNQVRGRVATRYRLPDREIDVLVQAQATERMSIDALRRLIINPQSQHPITLDTVASLQQVNGPSEIRRIDQQRVAIITAELATGDLGSAVSSIEQQLNVMVLPDDIVVSVTGQNQEMAVSFDSLQLALALAIFMVYLVMASQFESLLQPLIILATLPLALIGAIAALYITGSVINVIVFIGLIVLAGIVVNNGIVLIDLINRLRIAGYRRHEAIITAGRTRLRPIIMTSLTTILGLLPLAIGLGDGAEIRTPMAVTLIGGLLVSTWLTLINIPVIYCLVDRRQFSQDTAVLADSKSS